MISSPRSLLMGPGRRSSCNLTAPRIRTCDLSGSPNLLNSSSSAARNLDSLPSSRKLSISIFKRSACSVSPSEILNAIFASPMAIAARADNILRSPLSSLSRASLSNVDATTGPRLSKTSSASPFDTLWPESILWCISWPLASNPSISDHLSTNRSCIDLTLSSSNEASFTCLMRCWDSKREPLHFKIVASSKLSIERSVMESPLDIGKGSRVRSSSSWAVLVSNLSKTVDDMKSATGVPGMGTSSPSLHIWIARGWPSSAMATWVACSSVRWSAIRAATSISSPSNVIFNVSLKEEKVLGLLVTTSILAWRAFSSTLLMLSACLL